MMDPTLLPLFGRLTAALILGGAVGLQRERRGHPAGLRTHMLVALGSALITVVSISFSGPGEDPSRIAAQIVSGIGFLGAGTIIRHGQNVRGLTTAASLWAVAGIGIGAGRGGTMLYLTAFATVLVLVTLTLMDVVEDRFIGNTGRRDFVVLARPEALPQVFAVLLEAHIAIRSVVKSEVDTSGSQTAHMLVVLPRRNVAPAVLASVMNLEGVHHARWSQDTDSDD